MDDISVLMPMMAGFIFTFIVFMFILAIGVYVYLAVSMMTVAKRLKTKDPWLAWIPIGNLVLMSRMAKMHWWPVLLLCSIVLTVIPILGIILAYIAIIILAVYTYIWMWKICEARNRPGWWSLLQLIPFVGGIWAFVMWGILAWAKK